MCRLTDTVYDFENQTLLDNLMQVAEVDPKTSQLILEYLQSQDNNVKVEKREVR
jgi:hypothetical protein